MILYAIFYIIGQFLSLILFLSLFIRRRKNFIIPFLIHLVISIVCYALDFQSWTIFLMIGGWLISGVWIFLLRWDIDLKRWIKVVLVITALIHGLTWADAWYERLIQSGWYGFRIQHFEINEDYSVRVQKGGFSRFIRVDLVNKKHPINQKITRLRLEGSRFPIDDLEWIPLENDSIQIKIEYTDGTRKESSNCTIYLPDY